MDHGYCSFLKRQQPTLRTQIDLLLAVIYRYNQSVAKKMHNGLLYQRTLVIKNKYSGRGGVLLQGMFEGMNEFTIENRTNLLCIML